MASPRHVLVASGITEESLRLRGLLAQAGFSVDFCENGEEVPFALRERQTDVLLMQMVLKGRDGLGVLDALPEKALYLYPAVVLIYYKGMERFEEHAKRSGACAYLPNDASDGELVEVCGRVGAEERMYASARYSRGILRLITELGFPANLSGTQYIQTALRYTLSDYRLLRDMAHRLYPLTAARYGKDAAAVERGIRHAIEAAWNSGDYKRQNELLGYMVDEKRGRPTNSGMIAWATDYLRIKEKTA